MKNFVLLTYEFTYSPFSGNGILARSLVKSFLGLGCTVTVWCCRPSQENGRNSDADSNGSKDNNENANANANANANISSNSSDNHLAPPEISKPSMERLELLSTVVPSNAWRRVDDQSCWRDFTVSNLLKSDASREQTGRLYEAIAEADVVCAIDWTGAVAYRSIIEHRNQQQDDNGGNHHSDIKNKFHLYLNFRVFSFGVDDDKRRAWYNEMEYKAMENANIVVSLSSKDTQQLADILQEDKHQTIPIEIILPPLRQDMKIFAKTYRTSKDFLCHLPDSVRFRIPSNNGSTNYPAPAASSATNLLLSKRPFIVCVARQSPEKCIHRFVKFTEMAADFLQELNLTVVLAGAASDVEYARQSRQRLLRAVPSAVVIDRFLSPKELGALFAHTLVNFHPASYDAYGMTIVEAAAFGAPTVLAGSSIGAFRLLGKDGCLQVDMNSDDTDENVFTQQSLTTVVDFLKDCKNDEQSWEKLSMAAREKALAWDEKSYGEKMLHTIDKHNDAC
uniref:Glycosyl transferase family 1 domain-containing protein n=1 Tax=Pseudo-nitzschia australis TaxID=44445 RepID=A0A7S4EEE7_9STRA